MGVDAKTWESMKAAKENPPQQIQTVQEFAEKAESMRAPYDQNTRGFQSITSNINFWNEQKLTEDWEMSPEERKDRIVDAMVGQELSKKMYKFDPSKKSVATQKLELDTLKNNLKAEIQNDYPNLIGKAMEDAQKDRHLTAGDIAHRKAIADVAPKYRNIENYELPPQPVNQAQNERKINNPVMGGPKH